MPFYIVLDRFLKLQPLILFNNEGASSKVMLPEAAPAFGATALHTVQCYSHAVVDWQPFTTGLV